MLSLLVCYFACMVGVFWGVAGLTMGTGGAVGRLLFWLLPLVWSLPLPGRVAACPGNGLGICTIAERTANIARRFSIIAEMYHKSLYRLEHEYLRMGAQPKASHLGDWLSDFDHCWRAVPQASFAASPCPAGRNSRPFPGTAGRKE